MSQDRRQEVSALMDGEADAPSLVSACAAWRDDAELRTSWHAWHLIGDVLRSDELASSARRDAAFIATLRSKLASEPVVLAPPPIARRGSSRRAWSAAGAVAAGFVVVAGAVLVLEVQRAPKQERMLAGNTVSAAVTQRVAEATPPAPLAGPLAPAEPQFVIADGQLIRDARIDQYLRAHKPFLRGPVVPAANFDTAQQPARDSGALR